MRISTDAIIADRKLTDYLLIPLKYDDKSGYLAKAGFDFSSPDALETAIRSLSTTTDAIQGEITPHGTKWIISGRISGPNGRSLGVRLIWLQRIDDGRFHFVTLVPNPGGAP